MNYHNITHDDMLNGDGLRVVLWVAGCNHRCKGCQNPETWDCNGGLPFTFKEIQEIYGELSKDYISGITLSGGDPLHPNNRGDILNLVQHIRTDFPNKTIWLYTGYVWENILDFDYELLTNIDVLVDGTFIQKLNDNNLHWCGSKNQRVIDVQKSLKKREVVLYESN